MEKCQGVSDWLGCLKCEYLCSSKCPLERADVVESLSRHIRVAEAESAAPNHRKFIDE